MKAHGTALALALFLAACGGDPAAQGENASSPPPPAASPSPDHSAFVAAVDALAADALERGPIAGLSIAVHARGAEVLAKGYGFADVEGKAPATADTSYPIASVTKRLTAAAILRLADQGRLTLDDPLSRFFPAARPAIGALTVRHLLQHTSGLTRGGPAPRGAAQSVLARGGTGRAQGHDWTYSNYNFSLLGLVIEHVTGRDYAAYVEEELARPLGLTGTAYCEDGRPVAGRGKDYLSSPGSLTATAYWSEARFFAAGGLCSTVRDLVRWEQALQDGRVASAAMARAMHSPARLAGGVEVDYGLGTRLGFTGARRKIGHTGGGQGNKAVLARYPEDDVTIVVLLNTERNDATVTAMDIEDRVGRLFFGTAPDRAPDPAAVVRVAGDYQDGSKRVRARADGEVLVLTPGLGNGAPSRLRLRDDATFVSDDDSGYEVRFWDEGGRAGGYRRYRLGWFTGFAVRSSAVPQPQ
jgi:CubicO group peptidase (beta-lactamase class C family)